MLIKSILLTVTSVLIGTALTAQNIIINPNPTPTQLVQNTLIGPGLVTSNITFSGDFQQIGWFEENGSNLGLDSGVVMSSGYVANIAPPNFPSTTVGGPGDPDLLATAQSVTSNPQSVNISSTHDAAVLEFDFVPTGDVVIFNFVFGSEEYLTYVNSVFNDVFGFYITGPNPNGPDYNSDNLAIVPSTTEPITISTIHPGLNAQYYVDNPTSSGVTYNGYTIPIEIRFDVICDSTYHFKFAVADCQDGILDTGVFLDGGSFQAIPVDLSLETNVGGPEFGDSVIVEGCGVDADFIFTRPSCQSSDSLWVTVDIAGTAINGTDYATLPDSVLFLPDSTEIVIPFSAYQDGFFEGYESVIVTVTNVLPSGDTIVTQGIVWLFDAPNVTAIAHDTMIVCMEDSTWIYASGMDGIPPYTFEWDNNPGVFSDSTLVVGNPNGIYEYEVTITDLCGFTDIDTLTFIVNQTLQIDSLVAYPASSCNPDGAVAAYPSGETGVPLYDWTGPGPNSPNSWNATVWQNISPGWYYFTVTDDVCEASDSVFVNLENPPIAAIAPAQTSGCAPFEVAFVNNSENTVDYQWIFGNGDPDVNTSSASGQSSTYNSSTVATLIATDQYGCSDTAYAQISVIQCGCTDPLAINYNPLATQDDGSCYYPVPEVEAPNVFTPNGDGNNDVFFLETLYTEELELIITNRWGNVLYKSTGPNPGWDGLNEGGTAAAEGVYFYRYRAYGIAANGELGIPTEGHGFLHLVRD